MYRLLEGNPQLKNYTLEIVDRMRRYQDTKSRLLTRDHSLLDFANAHAYFGFHHIDGGWVYREWAPNAHQLYLTGEFNGWNWTQNPMMSLGNGCWMIYLQGDDALWEGCRVKTIVDVNMTRTAHVPLYARRVVKDSDADTWSCEVMDDTIGFGWTDWNFQPQDSAQIYEACVDNYREFADNSLSQIQENGYNTLLLTGVMEHADSQVTNFFAVSSRSGRPGDLKYLINKAHTMGIRVLLNVPHSHAAKNSAKGIHLFDGTEYQFFHAGEKGDHPAWGGKCFDYGKAEVLHFLLSNLKFWMTEYHFDGFRFGGVTSMLYHDHGLGMDFNTMDKYFSENTHLEAVTYLQLANELIHQLNPKAITIAEDMSDMPGMALPMADGGIGFDCRQG